MRGAPRLIRAASAQPHAHHRAPTSAPAPRGARITARKPLRPRRVHRERARISTTRIPHTRAGAVPGPPSAPQIAGYDKQGRAASPRVRGAPTHHATYERAPARIVPSRAGARHTQNRRPPGPPGAARAYSDGGCISAAAWTDGAAIADSERDEVVDGLRCRTPRPGGSAASPPQNAVYEDAHPPASPREKALRKTRAGAVHAARDTPGGDVLSPTERLPTAHARAPASPRTRVPHSHIRAGDARRSYNRAHVAPARHWRVHRERAHHVCAPPRGSPRASRPLAPALVTLKTNRRACARHPGPLARRVHIRVAAAYPPRGVDRWSSEREYASRALSARVRHRAKLWMGCVAACTPRPGGSAASPPQNAVYEEYVPALHCPACRTI
ncbi:hypothetical protein HYPSUDRAFT_207083 [Hypholoma sublateritium FD-334 SS-4]|uniref:Uncharacterized protein n=1 Tax=Hypholoma sublateritium (strain FD-334 SS-4) TaxID=945553 RepID=A0A0D2LZN0_HYPSF|nr:hypothetical protein HYPSUDRAFT_207083 [Hypholoma sublateritium FD-334 SS-4]